MTQIRKELELLEKQDEYVFHGSGYKIDVLKPRQAYHFINDNTPIADDDPGVHATPVVDIAIFMAIVSEVNASKGFNSFFAYKDSTLEFGASKETMQQIKQGAKGYVYVLKRVDFQQRNPIEYISYKPVGIIQAIEVTEQDLPANIQVK